MGSSDCRGRHVDLVVRQGQSPKEKELIFSEFMNEVYAKHVAEATIAANDVHGKLTDGNALPRHHPAELPGYLQETR